MTRLDVRHTQSATGVEVRTVAERVGSPVSETMTVETRRDPAGLTTVAVDGEVDMLTAPTLISVVDAELEVADCRRLLLDLRPVSFLGSSGLTALVAMAQRCSERQIRLRLVADGPRVTRPLEITGLSALFDLVDDPIVAWI